MAPSSRSVGLSDSARAVLAAITPGRQVTRPELGRELALSKPTVSAAIAELEGAGLVSNTGSVQGSLGRAASVYALGPGAGWTLGLDLGASHFELQAQGLDGSELRSLSSADRSAPALRRRAAAAVRQCTTDFAGHGPLRAVGIAVPRIVPTPTPATLADPWLPDAGLDDLVAEFRLRSDVPVLPENNVNCAALAELQSGAAVGQTNFVYLQVGLRIGMGLVLNGRLIRGDRGAAGEIARLPFPFAPGSTYRPDAFEHYVGSGSLLQRAHETWTDGAPPPTVPALFELAASGHRGAVAVVQAHARDIANAALAVVAVTDPALIVLGGGVGQNEQMAPAVERVLAEYGVEIPIRTSAFGDRASVRGATSIAGDYAMTTLVGGRYPARVDFGTWAGDQLPPEVTPGR
ncbi:ROK family transcriptional regulator [Nakamurella endophytica]|uniref:HTH marR-type domain-containing protein n=1 Tax=Nakamurella endophytica TaxID=1748367 RepID=A0A917SW46_9ACTN|nr:ROK family transcriptional regulator [Nakamurella endophytica]GGL98429.1 hypothetical protein GCM10011594_17900 [Nakamurella endophytica]